MSSEFSWGLKVQYTSLDQRQQHVHHFPDISGGGGGRDKPRVQYLLYTFIISIYFVF